MKTTQLITLGVMAATCTFASAQDKPKRPNREVPAHVLEKFDADKDGKISREERKAMMDEQKKAMLAKFDKDSDGKLSDDERATMRDEMKARREALLEKYDADKDGKLSPDERKAAIDAGEEIPAGGPRGPRGPGGRPGKGGPTPPPAE